MVVSLLASVRCAVYLAFFAYFVFSCLLVSFFCAFCWGGVFVYLFVSLVLLGWGVGGSGSGGSVVRSVRISLVFRSGGVNFWLHLERIGGIEVGLDDMSAWPT